MADVTATQFQQDANNAADWANGDENKTVTMRLGQQAKSPAKVIKDIQNQADDALAEINKSRGFRRVGTFASGFTYELANDVGIDVNGDAWVYTDIDALPVIVTADTVPSEPEYMPVVLSDAESVSDNKGTNVQAYIDSNLTPFKTVSDMKAVSFFSSLPEFTRIEWQGYYDQSDGGSNWGILRFGAHTEDGFSVFSIDANTYVEANLKGSTRLSVRKAGAKSEVGFDNSQIIQNVIEFAFLSGNRTVWIPPSLTSFECLSGLVFRKGSVITGTLCKQTDPRFDANINSSLYFPTASVALTPNLADLESNYIWSVAMTGFAIKGNRQAGSIGLNADRLAWANVSNVSIDRFDNNIVIKRGMKNSFVDTTSEFAESRCLYMVGAEGTSTTQQFTRCAFRAAPTLVDIESTSSGRHIATSMAQCLFESPTEKGVKLDRSCSLWLTDCYFENVPNDLETVNGAAIELFASGDNSFSSASIFYIRGGMLAGGNNSAYTDSSLVHVYECASCVIDSVEMKNATHAIRVDDSVGYGRVKLIGESTFSGVTNIITGKRNRVSGVIPNGLVTSGLTRGHFNPRGRIDFVNGGGAVGDEIGQEITWANSVNENVGASIKAVRESGAQGAAKLVFKTTNSDSPAVDRWQINQAGNFQPVTDNSYNLGSASLRVKEVYASVGTINTSDAREKTEVKELSEKHIEASIQLSKEIGGFKWLSSVAEKGELAREHIGMTVQRAIEILESNGIDPFSLGFICYDEWESQDAVYEVKEKYPAKVDENGKVIKDAVYESVIATDAVPSGNRYGFRYDQLILFIISGVEHRLSKAGI